MENNIRFRNHISVIFEKVVKTAGAAILIFAANFITEIEEVPGISDILLLIGAIAACILLAFAWHYIIWSRTYISIQNNALVLEKNTLNRKKNTIGISNISNINLEQNLFEMALGTCKLKLDTNSMTTADKTDVNIVLKKKDAENFRLYLLGLHEEEGTIKEVEKTGIFFKASAKEIFLHGLFALNFGTLLLILAAIGSFIPLVQEMRSVETTSGFESAISIVVVVWIAGGMIWKVVREFLRYLEFSIERRDDKVYLSYGIIKRVTYSIPVEKINGVRLNQTMIARVGKRYRVEVVNVGMGNDEEEQHSFFLPYGKKEKIEEQLAILLPEFKIELKDKMKRQPKGVFAVWAANGCMWLGIIVPIAAIAAELLNTGVIMVFVVTIVLVLYFALLRGSSFATDSVIVGEELLQIAQGHFSRYLLFVKYEKIQFLTIKQCIVAKKFGIEKGEIHLLASAMNRIHNLPYMKEADMRKLCGYVK